ncbi:MBL fold metallo-hydrolase [Pseudomonas sp. BN411]|uniref:MBL fold metallo-hydrolase n=1 Tax=Pseudomonas sp. BN411 TaxID=2567887 RepID=UPI0024538603|nr:MBL fold metallo-hydrolase [Pseudomonas sp. BN411]MDH4561927.1 MBL fold metallo-hydrolase [Pseudomonas sp. BN411]
MSRPLHPRHVLFAALALALPFAAPITAQAAPVAKQQTQVPGFYRMAVGDLEVTALYDGYVDLGTNLLKGASAEDIQSLLARMFIESSKGVQTAVNAYLVNTGKQLVLVDTGSSKCFGPTLGGILGNLKAAGYQPEQVDSVLLTHLHPDHACGLLDAEGKPAFANATVFVTRDEAGFWLNPEVAAKAPADSKAFFEMAQKAVAPYKAAGKLKTYSAGDALVEGVSVAPSPGHTPGHTGYLFSSNGQELLVWGDVVHSYATQFANPDIAIEFDVDNAKAIASRKQVFAAAAKDKLWVAGAHLPFPGLGHVRSEGEGKGYAWVPAEFGPIRSDR